MKNNYQTIQRLILTEKGTRLTEKQNAYVFKVHPDANKSEIKKAVEELFSVKVNKVNTMNRIGKKKRQRTANYGSTAAWKKAVVTLSEGSTIDLT